MNPDGESRMGSVSVSLSTDLRSDIVTKAEEGGPDVDDFRVAIYDARKKRLYNDSYANTSGREILLTVGEYRLVAQHGDSLGYGFDKPYYLADPTFTVDRRYASVGAVAKLANLKMAVTYDATISEVYSDYKVIVRHQKYKSKKVTFSKDETRFGYLPAGEVSVTIRVKDGTEWKYYEAGTAKYLPNDFVTFNVTSSAETGNITVNIKVDSSVEDKDSTIELPAFTVPQDAPSVTLVNFDGEGNVHEFVEGVNSSGASVSFIAKGALAHCYLDINSEYLAAKGVPASVDLANLTDEENKALKDAGFLWDEAMLTSRKFSYVNFSDIIEMMQSEVRAASTDVVLAEFDLLVEDSVGKTGEASFSIRSATVKPEVSYEDVNVWARRLTEVKGVIDKGNTSLLGLQYSADGGIWENVSSITDINDHEIVFSGLNNLEPAKTYYLRTIYNNNVNCVSPAVEFTTEAAGQLDNSGFEDYHLTTMTATPMLGSSYTRNWYLPYAAGEEDPWWACNSMQSMPSSHTGWTSTWCKNFPSSGYVNDSHSGNRAALLFCVNVSDTNTDSSAGNNSTYEGEIWIGTSGAEGNKATEGHAFTSRPSKLAFHYKYEPTDNRNFYVNAWIKDAAGNVIATAVETKGPASVVGEGGIIDWARHEIVFNYTDTKAKAASIYVNFSASYGNGAVKEGVEFSLGDETVKAHAGCFLKLDDIELIYE